MREERDDQHSFGVHKPITYLAKKYLHHASSDKAISETKTRSYICQDGR